MGMEAMSDTKYPMLDAFKEVLDEIEIANELEHKFIQDMLIRYEEGRLDKMTDKQFIKVFDIHEKYCGDGSNRDRLMESGRFMKP